jgi:pyruvate formate-lyase/glycerol dehydratase family glycyl radical enzyme
MLTNQLESSWNTFDRLRDHLFHQFENPPFDPSSGLTPIELEAKIEAYLAANPRVPRVVQKAHIFALILTRAQITVDAQDWFVDKLNHAGLIKKIDDRWLSEVQAGPLQVESDWFDLIWQCGLGRGLLDTGHISPGWDNMFSGGLQGLISQARTHLARLGETASPEQCAFYQAIEIVYTATIALARRFAAQARRVALEHPQAAGRMLAAAAACERVPGESPRTLYEALQFAWLMHQLIEMEGEMVRSMGHFDRLYLPYYRADIAEGRLTRAQAKELIEFFWYKFYAHTQGCANGKNFAFGGQYADGSEVTNELTYLALEAYEEVNTPDPKLSVRFLPTSEDRLYQRVADLIREGHNSFVLMNDVPAVEAQVRLGIPLEDARAYLPIGCYEPAVDGKETGCTMNIVINLAKGVELALNNGTDPLSGERLGLPTGDPLAFTDFEQVFAAFTAQMDFLLDRFISYNCAHERQWPQIHPSPLIAGTIDDCLARGQDIGQGGARYNSVGCVGVALANASDSLLAIQRAVFEEKKFSMAEILAALRSNFEGREALRQYLLNRIPKWGNDDPASDALTRRIADHFSAKVHNYQNARGGRVRASLFSLDYQWRLGDHTGATPDGRRARASLAPGVGPSAGLDRSGVTALIHSITRLDFNQMPNGAVLDITLHPSAVKGEDGLAAFVALIRTFFARGGYALQFNVFDAATLRDAQLHPENYASLQIRVTGWSVYFTHLSPFEQEQFIARSAHGF